MLKRLFLAALLLSLVVPTTVILFPRLVRLRWSKGLAG